MLQCSKPASRLKARILLVLSPSLGRLAPHPLPHGGFSFASVPVMPMQLYRCAEPIAFNFELYSLAVYHPATTQGVALMRYHLQGGV